jgi:ribosomal protein S27AE
MNNWNKEWRKRNPEKVRAHWIVSNAIRYGKLKRQPCEKCGNKKSHAHHADYSKPLEIKWLCHKCHWLEHGWETEERVKITKRTERTNTEKTKEKAKADAKWPLLIDKAIALRKKGKSYKEISESLRISQGTAYKWINNTTYD